MEQVTKIEPGSSYSSSKNWGIDNKPTSKVDKDKKADFILNTLNNVVKIQNVKYEEGSTVVDVGKIKKQEQGFKLPENYSNSHYSATKNYFSKTQNWTGYVIELLEKTFTARLKDETNGGTDEFAEFEISEVPLEDLKLLKEGAVFYYSIGYTTSLGGQISRMDVLRFQRLVYWEEVDYDEALKHADDLLSKLTWD